MSETRMLLPGLNGGVVLIVACLLIISGRLALLSSRELRKAAGQNEKYQDVDGAATEETQSRFSVFWQNVFIFIISTAALALSLVEAVLSEVNSWKSEIIIWLDLVVWVRFDL